jgi:uncharacterized protein YqjF (DUF2071 family)
MEGSGEANRSGDPGFRPAARRQPWVMRMRWTDLLFAHWAVPPEVLRPLVPPALELDTFGGQAWLGVVPFRMSNVAPRGLPAPPILGAFGEINVRTYASHGGRRGVWFLSLDAASRPTVLGARRAFHLPYHLARIEAAARREETDYRSERRERTAPPAVFDATYRPTGPARPAAPGSLDEFLTARFCLFAVDGAGRLERTDIRHRPWPLQPATAVIRTNTMAAGLGIALPDEEPVLHFSRRLDVVSWWPRRVAAGP